MRILRGDDQELIHRGLHRSHRWPLAKSLEFRPAIVILDIRQRMDGIEAIRLLRKALPQTKILSLSQYDIPVMVNDVGQAGAAAFVSKLSVGNKLVSIPQESVFG